MSPSFCLLKDAYNAFNPFPMECLHFLYDFRLILTCVVNSNEQKKPGEESTDSHNQTGQKTAKNTQMLGDFLVIGLTS